MERNGRSSDRGNGKRRASDTYASERTVSSQDSRYFPSLPGIARLGRSRRRLGHHRSAHASSQAERHDTSGTPADSAGVAVPQDTAPPGASAPTVAPAEGPALLGTPGGAAVEPTSNNTVCICAHPMQRFVFRRMSLGSAALRYLLSVAPPSASDARQEYTTQHPQTREFHTRFGVGLV